MTRRSFAFLDALGLKPALLDRLCDRDRAARHVGMQALDHAAVELHDALVLVLRQIERFEQKSKTARAWV